MRHEAGQFADSVAFFRWWSRNCSASIGSRGIRSGRPFAPQNCRASSSAFSSGNCSGSWVFGLEREGFAFWVSVWGSAAACGAHPSEEPTGSEDGVAVEVECVCICSAFADAFASCLLCRLHAASDRFAEMLLAFCNSSSARLLCHPSSSSEKYSASTALMACFSTVDAARHMRWSVGTSAGNGRPVL